MKLNPREARVIQELRGAPTAKIIITKHRGEIKAIHTEINAEIVDKAEGRGETWKKTENVRIEEPSKVVPRETIEAPTREGAKE